MQAKMTVMGPAVRATKGLVYSAVALSLGAALIHLWVTPEHFEEWWGYGTFMLAAFVAQAIYAVFLLGWPRWPLLLLAGASGNLAIIGMWVVSRTVGTPIGPMAGDRGDRVTRPDLYSCGAGARRSAGGTAKPLPARTSCTHAAAARRFVDLLRRVTENALKLAT